MHPAMSLPVLRILWMNRKTKNNKDNAIVSTEKLRTHSGWNISKDFKT